MTARPEPGPEAAVVDEGVVARAMRRRNAIVGGILVLAILAMINYLSFRHYARWDWTADSLFTLSERTEELLRGLEQPVEIYIFLSEGEESFEDLDEIARRYVAISDRVALHQVDPDRQPSVYQGLAQRFELATFASPDGGPTMSDVAAVVVSGERRWKITRDDLFSTDFDSLDDEGGPRVDVKTEQALTGAIVEVTSGRPTKLCVSTGHGEWALGTGGQRSLLAAKDDLERQNIAIEAVEVRGATVLPDDCDAVFVVGPQRAFSEREAGALGAYLREGGNVLLALDPELGRQGEGVLPTGLERVVAEAGVLIDDTVVFELDSARLLAPDPVDLAEVVDFGDHPITEPLRNRGGSVVVRLVRSVRPAEGSDATTLLSMSAQAFAETDMAHWFDTQELQAGPSDLPGPVSIGVAVAVPVGAEAGDDEGHDHAHEGEEEGDAGGRLVVLGDADWLTAELLAEPRMSNLDLLSAVTGWLTEREALIAIAPRQVRGRAILMTEDALSGVAFRVIVLMPLAFLLMGLYAFWTRRS